MFSSTLESFKQIYGCEPRIGVYELLKLIDEKIRDENPKFLIFFSAPTGYGKSSCTLAIANALVEKPNPLGERLIHVLPLRSIVEDLYANAVEKREKQKLNAKLTLGVQAMHLLDVQKSPYMLPSLVYTTMDSFIHNLFKRPVAEMQRDHSHFDVPRYAIYSSLIVFDEAHLFSSEVEVSEEEVKEKHNRMLTSFYASIQALTEASVPLIVMTATMPDNYIKSIIEHSLGDVDVYVIEVKSSSGKKVLTSSRKVKKVTIDDHEFHQKAYKNNPKIQGIIKEEDIKRIILEQTTSYKDLKILIVRNTVAKALATYEKLVKNCNAGYLIKLIHGRMNVEDRENTLKLIKNVKEGIILVATQVIEAGVNIDFDILISDVTTFSSLVQRIGRVGREIEKRKIPPKVYVLEGEGDGVYSKKLVKATLDKLKMAIQKGLDILWRVSFEDGVCGNSISYRWLLEEVYREIEYREDKDLYDALTDIDHYFVSSRSLKKLQHKICSFVREEGLIPISSWIKGNQEFKDSHEAQRNAYKTILPLNTSFLLSKWMDILNVNTDKKTVKILVWSGKWVKVEDSEEMYEVLDKFNKPCKFLNEFDKAMGKFKLKHGNVIPLALVVHEGMYEQGAGLKIE